MSSRLGVQYEVKWQDGNRSLVTFPAVFISPSSFPDPSHTLLKQKEFLALLQQNTQRILYINSCKESLGKGEWAAHKCESPHAYCFRICTVSYILTYVTVFNAPNNLEGDTIILNLQGGN